MFKITDLDPTKLQDWQVAEEAEKHMKTVFQLAKEIGLQDDELIPMGHYLGKVDFIKVLNRLSGRPNGKYVDVTAITPTPLGEGKTTTTMGLVPGLAKRGKSVCGAIRQPSGGPTFNVKGGAAGGGLSQCIPLTPFSLGLTGDIDNVNNAHNLAMVAVTSRIQHEFNYDDATLAKKRLKRLDIDPRNVQMKWVIDFCAQALRDMVIGIGGNMDGFMMSSGFAITVSSEVMAILAVSTSLKDLRERMGKIVIGYSKQGKPVTTDDLDVAGAMTAWMVKAINPNLLQTLEGQPVFVHAGPFANIAVGQNSIIADQIALKLSDYVVTESGFGADIGFEKFWNIKCRLSKLVPNCAVIVATIRALKMHGGGPRVAPGQPLDAAYTSENIPLLEKGFENLLAHIETVKKSGINPVVCINSFHTDTGNEIKVLKKLTEQAGARVAVSQHWLKGGEGALELADAVIDACNEKTNFKLLYDDKTPLRQRIEKVAKEVYGADGVSYTPLALEKAKKFEADPAVSDFATCMVKTHLSLSHDPTIKGRPKNWVLPIRDILIYGGAKFLVPVAGEIKLMPGTASDACFPTDRRGRGDRQGERPILIVKGARIPAPFSINPMMLKHRITFYPSERSIFVDEHENLLQAAMEAGIHINASCGGNATCGKCKIRLIGGSLDSPMHDRLSPEEYAQGYRLACLSTINGSVDVEIPLESQVDKSVLALKGDRGAASYLLSPKDIFQLVQDWEVDPAVFKRYVELDPPSLTDNKSDLTRLMNGIFKQHGINGISTDFRVIMKLSRVLREADWKVTVTLVLTRKGYKLTNIEAGDNRQQNYSIVIDIGTTTIFGQILNLNECKVVACPDGMCDGSKLFALAEASDYNAQISFGEDVITRIVYSQKPGGLKKLQATVVSIINSIIDELLKMSNIERSLISHLVVAGNTTMTQLFLGIDPKYLRESPYVPTAHFIPPVRAVHLGINIGEHVHIYIFPMVASYVGGDIVAGILGSGVFQREDLTLYMDIGTNGEIVLGNKDWLASVSCSAGPAFEGAGIRFGMRATRGAIEEVSINPRSFEPMLLTIGRAKPIGICGSGLIDAVAELLETGVIDQKGKFLPGAGSDRVREGRDGWEYVLAYKEETRLKEDLVITELDIENLIRTKGAIYAGCKILLESVGLGFKDLDRVIIAGGFGRHLDLEKAMFIGLLPELDIKKFIFVGNGSLLGARLLSFSRNLLGEAERISLMMTNLELSNHAGFMGEFMAAMFLPHTDTTAFPKAIDRLRVRREAA